MNALRIPFIAAVVILCGSSFAAAQAPSKGPKALAGTEWHGSEDLDGYGKLAFKFAAAGKATMIDAAGTSPGTYELDRDTVTIAFGGGNVVYTGKVAGNTISGEAMDAKFKPWKWRVTLKGAGPGLPVGKGPGTLSPGSGAPAPGTLTPGTPAPLPPGKIDKLPVVPGRLTPEKLPELLRKMGFKVDVVPMEIGGSYCVIQLEKGALKQKVEVSVTKEGTVWLTTPLVEVPESKFATAKLLQILEANITTGPCFFCYRSADNRLCLRLEVVNVDDIGIRGDLNMLLGKMEATRSLWEESAWR